MPRPDGSDVDGLLLLRGLVLALHLAHLGARRGIVDFGPHSFGPSVQDFRDRFTHVQRFGVEAQEVLVIEDDGHPVCSWIQSTSAALKRMSSCSSTRRRRTGSESVFQVSTQRAFDAGRSPYAPPT